MGTGYIAHHCVECGSSYYGGMTGQPIACPYCVIIQLRELLKEASPCIRCYCWMNEDEDDPECLRCRMDTEALNPND